MIRSCTGFLSLSALTAATIPSLTSSQRKETLRLTFHARHLFLHSSTLPILTFWSNSLRRFHSSAGGPFSFPSAGRAGCRFVAAPGRERDPLLKKLWVGIRRCQRPSLLLYLCFFFFFLFLHSLCCSQFFQASLFGARQGRGGWGRVVRGIQKV